MQDLVRIGVADAAEQPRIGERALERVVLSRQPFGERVDTRVERLQATAVERRERLGAAHEVDRRAALGARLGEHEGTGCELELGQRYGLIKFSSRTDVLMPADVELQVAVGDRVIGGETILAKLP